MIKFDCLLPSNSITKEKGKRKRKKKTANQTTDKQTTDKQTTDKRTMGSNNSSLASSYPLTHKAYQEFYEDIEQFNKTEAWENCSSETMNGVMGTIPGGPNAGKPVFQFNPAPHCTVPLGQGGSMVGKSPCGRFLAIAPCHGGRHTDPKTPHNLQHVRNDICPMGIMSLLHFLIIPNPEHPDFKTTKRYANAMTLGAEDLEVIGVMEDLGNKVMNEYLDAGSDKVASLRWWLSRASTDTVELSSGLSVSEKIDQFDFKDDCRANFNSLLDGSTLPSMIQSLKENKAFSFHLAKRTVNWLHMHVWLPDLGTVNLYQLERSAEEAGHEKNTPTDVIRMFINSGVQSEMKVKAQAQEVDEGCELTRTDTRS